MKKQALIGILLLVSIFLAGCEMPFVTAEKETLEKYIETQAEMVQSSVEVDEQLQLSLQATLKETEKKDFPSAQLLNEVRSARTIQTAIYQQVQNQEEPFGKEHMKKIYLDVLKTHINSYEQYEDSLKKGDRKTFGTALSLNQIKEEDILDQSLILLNQELAKYNVEPRESLLPIEKKTDK